MRIDEDFTPNELLGIHLYLEENAVSAFELAFSGEKARAMDKLRGAVKASLVAGLERAVDRTATEPSNIDPEIYNEAFKVVDHLNDIQPEDNE